MLDRYHSAEFQYEYYDRLTALAEHRHAATAACYRLAGAAKTPEDRARYEDLAPPRPSARRRAGRRTRQTDTRGIADARARGRRRWSAGP